MACFTKKNLLAAITFLFCSESFQALSQNKLALCVCVHVESYLEECS